MQENQNNQVNNTEEQELDINHLMQIRRDKLKELQEQGKDPFEITKFNRTNTAGEIKANYEQFAEKDVTVKGFLKDDVLVLTSDGLTNMVKDQEIFDTIKFNIDIATDKLVDKANENGGLDNITVIIVLNKNN